MTQWDNEITMASLQTRNKTLELALREILATAKFEQEKPTGMHMTCLSIIEKKARQALDQ